PSPVSVRVKGPGRVAIGQQAVFEVQLKNSSARRFLGLTLNAQLSGGLQHPTGQNIDATIGDLAPGASKSLNLSTKAVKAGKQVVEFHVLTQEGEQATTRAGVFVGEAGLTVHVPSSTRVLLDRATEVRIEVANYQPQAARNVVVTGTLPPEVEYSGA